METEEEEAYVFEGEDEEEDIMESEDEEEEEEEEEAEQLDEEMRPPVMTSWKGADGTTVHGIICIDDGIIRLKNRCQLDDCSICLKPSTTHGKHQICSLPCGHTYGFSCIKKWLLQSSSRGKCPQCKTLCSFAILLSPRLCDTAHQKTSSAEFFPFTKQGYLEFEKYEFSRMLDARSLLADDITHENILVRKHNELEARRMELARQWVDLFKHAEELEERSKSLELAHALRRRANRLKPRIDALGRRTDALRRLVLALRRRMDALEQRSDAFESRMEFYIRTYKEHQKREEEIAKAKQGLERNIKLVEMAAAKAKKKGQEEAEKAAEKKLKDKERNEKEKMQASGTVEVSEEETAKDVAEEPEEEKVEKKAKPTTKTTELRSRSNRGNGPDSISKMIHKRTKSNNYMYYYAAGAAAVLIVPLAVGYTLYA